MKSLCIASLALVLGGATALAQVACSNVPIVQARVGHTMCSAPGRVLMAGGSKGGTGGDYKDIFEFVNGAWVARGVATFGLPFSDAAFDSNRGTLVVLYDEGGAGMSLVEWTDGAVAYPANVPASLYGCTQQQIVFDPVRAACVVRGYNVQAATNELWSFDGISWSLVGVTSGGPGLGTFDLVTTPGGGFLLVGLGWTSSTMETWWWLGGAWSSWPAPPVGNYRFDATNDVSNGDALVVGYPAGTSSMAVFLWSGGVWVTIGSNGPDLGNDFEVAHDGSQVVLFGGRQLSGRFMGDTWVFANGSFAQVGKSPPGALLRLCGCFDESRGRTVWVGVGAGGVETWEWDGGQFSRVDTQPGFFNTSLVYDRGRQVVVQYRDDGTTLEWNGASWTTTVFSGLGPARIGAGLGYDGQRVILFGGAPPSGATLNETWAYDGASWAQLTPSTSPPPNLYRPLLVEDRLRGILVMVPSLQGALYEWNGSNWSAPIPAPPLSLKQDVFAAFHPARGRVVFGGGLSVVYVPTFGTSVSLAAWEWDGATFQPAPNLTAGWIRSAAVAGPDGNVLVGGGWNSTQAEHEDLLRIGSAWPASVRTFGTGCAGSAGVPRLFADPWRSPWIGDGFELRCDDLPPGAAAALWVLGLSNTQDSFGPLPRDLAWAGAPGCLQRVAADLAWIAPAFAGLSTWAVGVPDAPALVGLQLHLQTLSLDQAANPGGFVLSDASTATVGSR